jgi:hypothetical protein
MVKGYETIINPEGLGTFPIFNKRLKKQDSRRKFRIKFRGVTAQITVSVRLLGVLFTGPFFGRGEQDSRLRPRYPHYDV